MGELGCFFEVYRNDDLTVDELRRYHCPIDAFYIIQLADFFKDIDCNDLYYMNYNVVNFMLFL